MLAVPWPVVGRDAARERVRECVGPGGPGVVVAGPPGIGKTALVRAALDGEPAPAWITCTRATAGIPLAAAAPLLATGPVTGGDGGTRGPGAPGPSPPVVVVDDAHLLDPESAALVRHLGRSGSRLVLTAEDDVRDALGLPGLDLLRLEPLGLADVGTLLERVLGDPADMALTHRLLQASGGNALVLREVVTGTWEAGGLRREGGRWRLVSALRPGERLSDLLYARLAPLGPGARAAAELVALGEPVPVAVLERLVAAGDLSRLVDEGLVRIEGGEAGMAHPAYGEAICDALPRMRRRSLLLDLAEGHEAREAAGSAADGRAVRWRLERGDPVEPARLVRAARRALEGNDAAFSLRCAAEAFRQDGSADAGLVYGEALVLSGRHAEAEEVLRSVESRASQEPAVVLGAEVRAHNLLHGLGRRDEALSVLKAARSRIRSADLRRRLTCQQAAFELCAGRPAEALRLIEPVLAEEAASPSVEAILVGSEARALAGRFNPCLELLDRLPAGGARAACRSAFDPDAPLVARLFVSLHTGAYAEVTAAAEPAHARALAGEARFVRGWCACLLGSALLVQGRAAAARSWFDEGVTAFTEARPDPRARMALAGVLHASALLGDGARADQAERKIEAVPAGEWRQFEAEVARARAWAAVQRGMVDDGAHALSAAAAALGAVGSNVLEAEVLHDLVRLGRADPGQLDRLVELAGVVEGDLAQWRGAHAAAVRAGAWEAMERVVGGFETLGAPLPAAEVAAAAAGMARKAGRSRAAERLAARARDLAAACDGVAAPTLVAARVEVALTARERDVAVLAGRGMPNAEIAEHLGLSVRTVENTLARAYPKLGVGRRSELAAALGLDG